MELTGSWARGEEGVDRRLLYLMLTYSTSVHTIAATGLWENGDVYSGQGKKEGLVGGTNHKHDSHFFAI